MELAPELTFRHYTLGEVQLPADAFVRLEGIAYDAVAVCCDRSAHVFNPQHTNPRIVEALKGTHWLDVHEAAARGGDR
jgi:hypothetical protein